MKTLKDLDVKGKRVILRCDLDVSFDKDGNIIDGFKAEKIIPTIKFLLENNSKIIILGHMGRPWEEASFPRGLNLKRNYSLASVGEYLSRTLNRKVVFLEDCLGRQVEKTISEMKKKDIVLLENIRFYREEKENNEEFAKKLAGLGEVFVNDAFSAIHLKHASIIMLPSLLPSCAGLLLEEEINNLNKVDDDKFKPVVGIFGGVDLSKRINVITKFLKTADHILIGGKIANVILAAKGISIGKFLINPELESMAGKIELTNPKVHLPIDGIVSLNPIDTDYIHVAAVGRIRKEEECFDIGPETIELFSKILQTAKTVIWDGPMGFVEHEKFIKGSSVLADEIIKSKAYSIAGGEATVNFLRKYNFGDKFNHLSTGGEAVLEYLADKRLVGLKALE